VTPADVAFLGTAFRVVGGLVEGKHPALALLEALQPLLPQPQLPPPRQHDHASDWAARMKAAWQAAAQPPLPAVDPAVAAREKKISDLEARAVHPNTPEEEARTAAIIALRLKHGKESAQRPSPMPPAPTPAPTNAGRTATTKGQPEEHQGADTRSTSPSTCSDAAATAIDTKPTCPKCKKPIHRGGVTFDPRNGTSAVRYHAKCAPRRDA
jgi:hypothetical protein